MEGCLSQGQEGSTYLLRLLCGSFHRFCHMHTGHEVEVTLVSRRHTLGTGCRFTKRGMDRDGGVANCVETEQILRVWTDERRESHHTAKEVDEIASVVVMRGSVPVHWRQEIETQCGCCPMRIPDIQVDAPPGAEE